MSLISHKKNVSKKIVNQFNSFTLKEGGNDFSNSRSSSLNLIVSIKFSVGSDCALNHFPNSLYYVREYKN